MVKDGAKWASANETAAIIYLGCKKARSVPVVLPFEPEDARHRHRVDYHFGMSISFRAGFYFGVIGALLFGGFFLWLWQPDRQVSRHTESLFRAIEQKNWEQMADLISGDYRDDWGHDRSRVLERTREMFRYLRSVKIGHSPASIRIDNDQAHWSARIEIDAEQSDIAALLKERVNSVATPFELEWRRVSRKPWDWKLASVKNPDLQIPPDSY